jgi:hypothetical protein
MGRRSGNGEKIRRKQPMHINAKILRTTTIIATLMSTSRKNVGNYIQSRTQRTARRTKRKRIF